jgi:hypothetical protein
MWPDDARSTLIRAVSGAFNKRVLPSRRNIYITSEPEACTLYVIHDVIRQDLIANNPRPLKIVSSAIEHTTLILTLLGRLLCFMRCWRRYNCQSQSTFFTPYTGDNWYSPKPVYPEQPKKMILYSCFFPNLEASLNRIWSRTISITWRLLT